MLEDTNFDITGYDYNQLQGTTHSLSLHPSAHEVLSQFDTFAVNQPHRIPPAVVTGVLLHACASLPVEQPTQDELAQFGEPVHTASRYELELAQKRYAPTLIEHLLQVASKATYIGRFLRYTPEQLEILQIQALTHDMGKLNKDFAEKTHLHPWRRLSPSLSPEQITRLLHSHVHYSVDIYRDWLLGRIPVETLIPATAHHLYQQGKPYSSFHRLINENYLTAEQGQIATWALTSNFKALTTEDRVQEMIYSRGKQFAPLILAALNNRIIFAADQNSAYTKRNGRSGLREYTEAQIKAREAVIAQLPPIIAKAYDSVFQQLTTITAYDSDTHQYTREIQTTLLAPFRYIKHQIFGNEEMEAFA